VDGLDIVVLYVLRQWETALMEEEEEKEMGICV
jgi:hypothetical protein